MQRVIFIIICMTSILWAGVTLRLPNGDEIPLYSDYFALIIGNYDYLHFNRLPGVKEDVRDIKAMFEKMGITTKVLENQTGAQMLDALNNFVDIQGIDANRALIFYFAGHGFTETLADGSELGYIIPTDAPLHRNRPGEFRNRAISMNKIIDFARLVKSKHVLMMFDSCFSGTIFSARRSAPQIITYKTSQPVRQFITAGSADQPVPDHSIFKSTLLMGLGEGDADLNEDGYVTGEELGSYLEDKVVNYSHGAQTPKFGTIANPNLSRGDFVFAVAPQERRTVPKPPPIPSQPVPPGLQRLTGSLRITSEFETEIFINRQYKDIIKPGYALNIPDLRVGSWVVEYFYQNAKLGENVRIEDRQTAQLEIKIASVQQRLQRDNRFTIKTDPADSEITIEGYPALKGKSPFLIFDPVPSEYVVHVKRSMYREGQIEVKTQATRSAENTIKLTPLFGDLILTSNPSGSKVWINDRQVGVTPLELTGHTRGLDPGTYRIKLETTSDQYLPITKEIKISAAQVQKEHLIHEDNVGFLSVESDYYPISIKRNGQELAILQNYGQVKIPPGTATFSFEPQVRSEIPLKTHTTELTIKLKEVMPTSLKLIPEQATLSFSSDQELFDILTTNLSTGNSEKVKGNAWSAYPGSYSITASNWGYYAIERDVNLKENERIEQRFDFEPLPNEIMRPYARSKSHQRYGLISMGLTVGASLFMLYTADQAHQDYMAADTPLSAQSARKDFERTRDQFYATCGVNVLSAGYYIWSLINKSHVRADIEREMFSRTRRGK